MELWELLGCPACLLHGLGDQEGCFSCCLQGGCVFIPCGCSGLGRAELGDLHDIAGTLNTLVQPVCPPLDHCPLPSCPSAASPVTPSTGCGHRSPWGCSWGQEGQGQQQVWLEAPSVPIPCHGNTHVQSGAQPEHLNETYFPSLPKAAFLEPLCLSVCLSALTLPPHTSTPCACMSRAFLTAVPKML